MGAHAFIEPRKMGMCVEEHSGMGLVCPRKCRGSTGTTVGNLCERYGEVREPTMVVVRAMASECEE